MSVTGKYTNFYRNYRTRQGVDKVELIVGAKYSDKGGNNELAKKRIRHSLDKQFSDREWL